MIKAIFILYGFCSLVQVSAQGNESSLFSQTGYFNTIPDVNDILSSVKSNAYFENEEFSAMRILLDADTHTPLIVGRIDLYNEVVEVNVSGDIFGVDLKRIYQIEQYDKISEEVVDTTIFVNSGRALGAKKDHIMEVIVEGKNPLLLQRKVKFQRANYNKALDIGSREDKHLLDLIYYVLHDHRLIRIPLGNERKMQKTLQSIFPEYDGNLIFEDNELALINFIKSKNNKNDK